MVRTRVSSNKTQTIQLLNPTMKINIGSRMLKPSIHPSYYPPIHPSINHTILPSVLLPSINQTSVLAESNDEDKHRVADAESIHPSIHPSYYPSIHHTIHPSYPTIHPSYYPSSPILPSIITYRSTSHASRPYTILLFICRHPSPRIFICIHHPSILRIYMHPPSIHSSCSYRHPSIITLQYIHLPVIHPSWSCTYNLYVFISDIIGLMYHRPAYKRQNDPT
jgi:hypothetical protein